jgi:hypothetical protein
MKYLYVNLSGMKTHTSQLQLRNSPGYHVEDMEDEHIASTNAGEESLGDAF